MGSNETAAATTGGPRVIMLLLPYFLLPQRRREIKMVVLGASGVGKSSLALLAAPLAVASRDAAKEWSVVNLRVSVLRLGTQRRAVLFAGSSLACPFLLELLLI